MNQGLWSRVAECLKGRPERLSVARILVVNGFCVRDNRIFCNEIEVPIVGVAKAAGVDRRTVVETIKMISEVPELKSIFTNIRSAGSSLKEIARNLDFGVIEITPDDPRTIGILAKAASLVSGRGITIRQTLCDDPELHPEPKLTFIVEKKIPGELIPEFLKIKGVEKVSVY